MRIIALCSSDFYLFTYASSVELSCVIHFIMVLSIYQFQIRPHLPSLVFLYLLSTFMLMNCNSVYYCKVIFILKKRTLNLEKNNLWLPVRLNQAQCRRETCNQLHVCKFEKTKNNFKSQMERSEKENWNHKQTKVKGMPIPVLLTQDAYKTNSITNR